MKRLSVISLGGGVQSSVMALIASEGAFCPMPDCAIFADTHWEPPSIYAHLDWLAGQLRFPLYVVDNGRSLREGVKALTNHSGNRNFVDLPVYLKGRNGQSDGMGLRVGQVGESWASPAASGEYRAYCLHILRSCVAGAAIRAYNIRI